MNKPTFTNEQYTQIIERIRRTQPPLGHCNSCGSEKVSILPGFAYFVIQNGGTVVEAQGQIIPALMLQCTICGTITFKNPIVLGLEQLLELPKESAEELLTKAKGL